MSRGGPCSHRACQGDPDGCRMLTATELEPDEDDRELGRRLVAEGWIQTSAKYRMIVRWKPDKHPPPVADLERALSEFPEPHRAWLIEQ